MGYPEEFVSQLINGDVELTPKVACWLEMVLGAPDAFWSNLEAAYRCKLVRAQDENSLRDDMRPAACFSMRRDGEAV